MKGRVCEILTVPTVFVLLELILLSAGFEYNRVPDLIKVRRRADAGDAEFVALDFIGLVAEQGREAERYSVTTEDGYILALFRLPPNPNSPRNVGKNRVIFLHPGLAASADCFVIFGKERSLAHILSDAGYDVWIGNVRGGTYSRNHTTLKPTDADFWDISIDDYALLDVPTMIDYVLETTGQSRISYVGHSLGTTTIMMLLSAKPEYNKKIDLIFHFAPMAYWVTKSPMRLIVMSAGQFLQNLLDPRGATELIPQSSTFTAFFKRLCAPNNIVDLCYLPFDLLLGASNPAQMNKATLINYLNYYPAGTSAKAFYQYRQHAQTGKFQRYDYENPELNLKHYGQTTPPLYDTKNIVVPSVLFRAENDPLCTVADIKSLISHLPRNLSLLYEVVPYKDFNHLDFVTAKDVKTLVYDRLMEILTGFHNKYENNDDNNRIKSKYNNNI
ncbi:gastric triacylglycerol lipase [Diachasma alloeum]|uniref:gastric triacylglycerol lipase n=1 Tax=Diachasma alloeum TaxID=454923 RepID=UPI00073841CC|nr:gastric triacylglycerol lipase [Diachasma alloeum]